MTNFEQYKENLQEQKLIDSMINNCDVCPIPYDCPCYTNITEDIECEDVLRKWCESEAIEAVNDVP